MKTKPKALNLIAGFLVALAPALPVQIMLLYGHTPLEIQAIAAKLTPLNWAIFFFAPVTGYLVVYRASRLTLLALPLLATLVGYNNWFVGQVGDDYSPWVTQLATVGFVAAIGLVFSREALQAILHPKRRWWMTPIRRQAEVAVRLQIHNKQFRGQGQNDELYTKTFDISEGGAFIPFVREGASSSAREAAANDARFKGTNLRVGTQCYVCINVKETSFIQCRAEIVRVTHSNGRYPAGMGIRFLGLSWEEKRVLGNYLKTLPSKAAVVAAAA